MFAPSDGLLATADVVVKWLVHRQLVFNDNIFVFNVDCVDAFRRVV